MEENMMEEFNLDEAMETIDQILSKMGEREVSLEKSLEMYQQGMDLLQKCNDELDRVEKLMLQMDEEGQLHEFS